jgi:hypothetical protein
MELFRTLVPHNSSSNNSCTTNSSLPVFVICDPDFMFFFSHICSHYFPVSLSGFMFFFDLVVSLVLCSDADASGSFFLDEPDLISHVYDIFPDVYGHFPY